MKIINKTISLLFLIATVLASCNRFISQPTTSSTEVVETAMSNIQTAIVETQTAIPTATFTVTSLPSNTPQSAVYMSTSSPLPPVQTPFFPIPFDRHDPEAVLRAYLDAWNRNDFDTTAKIDGGIYPEPVEYLHILEMYYTATPSPTECTFHVLFDIKMKGEGISMRTGKYSWTYVLTWDADRDIWLITNHGY